MTLNEMLCHIDQLSEDGLEMPKDFSLSLKDKIDSYYDAMKFLEAQGSAFKEQSEALYQRSKAFKNKANQLREYLFFNMKAFQWEEIKGAFHSAKIVHARRFAVKKEADPEKFVGEEFVLEKKHYEFDQEKLKFLLETDPQKVENICEIKETEYVRIN